MVQVQGSGSTLIECIGDAKSRKDAAEEHAAEGALWYLKHIGLSLTDEINPMFHKCNPSSSKSTQNFGKIMRSM